MRIDTAREKGLEPRVDRRRAQAAFDERVETEGRQMPFVEHDRMAQRNWLREVRLIGEQIEQPAGSRAIADVPVEQRLAVERR